MEIKPEGLDRPGEDAEQRLNSKINEEDRKSICRVRSVVQFWR